MSHSPEISGTNRGLKALPVDISNGYSRYGGRASFIYKMLLGKVFSMSRRYSQEEERLDIVDVGM